MHLLTVGWGVHSRRNAAKVSMHYRNTCLIACISQNVTLVDPIIPDDDSNTATTIPNNQGTASKKYGILLPYVLKETVAQVFYITFFG